MGGYPELGSPEFPKYPDVPHTGLLNSDVGYIPTDQDGLFIASMQSWAVPATEHQIEMNQKGITNPELHRFINIHPYEENVNPDEDFHELGDRKYLIGIRGVESMRTTERVVRNYGDVTDPEDTSNPNNTLEIP